MRIGDVPDDGARTARLPGPFHAGALAETLGAVVAARAAAWPARRVDDHHLLRALDLLADATRRAGVHPGLLLAALDATVAPDNPASPGDWREMHGVAAARVLRRPYDLHPE